MLYEFCVYGSDDYENRRIIRWSSEQNLTQPVICDKLVTFMDYETDEYVIPEGILSLGEECFVDSDADIFDCFATKLELPASLEAIEDNAFLFASFQSISLNENNKSFMLYNGGLYTADGKRLIHVCTPPETEYYVKDGTEIIDFGVINNYVILHVPASVKSFGSSNEGVGLLEVEDLRIYALKDSFAAKFASENGMDYIPE